MTAQRQRSLDWFRLGKCTLQKFDSPLLRNFGVTKPQNQTLFSVIGAGKASDAGQTST
jgi:hypothetical protein